MAEGMLELSIADVDSCPVITLSGQADVTTASRLDELITGQLSRGLARLVVDAADRESDQQSSGYSRDSSGPR